MRSVRELFTRYYSEVKDCLYPEGPIIAIQLENEYRGKYSHIAALKSLAIKIGFKLPIYTATAWPCKLDAKEVLPLYGTYPEAPWTQNIKPLPAGDRFKIIPHFIDNVIGNDRGKYLSVDNDIIELPFGTCELGAGVQSTDHRRPIISTKDAYALSLITIAKGANILGYYVYHGGRNPSFAPLQETRKTFFPNNLPLLNYDFQAPLDEYGYPREKYYYLRLLHYFCRFYDPKFPGTRALFPLANTQDYTCSVRIRPDGGGYIFINTYERGIKVKGSEGAVAKVITESGEKEFPIISLPDGESFFYPFNFMIAGTKFDYITAQPFLRYSDTEGEHYLFIRHPAVKAIIKSQDGLNQELTDINGVALTISYEGKKHFIELYDYENAIQFYYDEQSIFKSSEYVYGEGDNRYRLISSERSAKGIELKKLENVKMKYDKYFYGIYKPSSYSLKVDKDTFTDIYDIRINFKSNCDMAHIYVGEKVVGDYINIDNNFSICLKRYRKYIEEGQSLIIRTSAIKPRQRTYFESKNVAGDSALSIKNIYKVSKEKV
jgi:hypothetical protein